MDARAAQFFEKSRAALRDDTIQEIQRRLVAIHVVISEKTDDDREVRSWSARQLMQLIDDIDDAVTAQRTAEKAKAAPTR